jgi:hypothetical protein
MRMDFQTKILRRALARFADGLFLDVIKQSATGLSWTRDHTV